MNTRYTYNTFGSSNPADTHCWLNIDSTFIQHHDVESTLNQCWVNNVSLLGTSYRNANFHWNEQTLMAIKSLLKAHTVNKILDSCNILSICHKWLYMLFVTVRWFCCDFINVPYYLHFFVEGWSTPLLFTCNKVGLAHLLIGRVVGLLETLSYC